MGLSYNERRAAKKAFDWLWKCFKKQRAKKAGARFTNHVADKKLGTSLPRTVEQLRVLRDNLAQTPEGGALIFVMALINYCSVDNHDEGVKMCLLSMWEENVVPSNAPDNYNGYVLHRSDVERLNRASLATANSYVIGTSPDNDYTIPNPNKIEIGFRNQNEYAGSNAEGVRKLFIWSSGADTARPITMKRNANGVWKASEFSSLVVEVRPKASTANPAAYAALAL